MPTIQDILQSPLLGAGLSVGGAALLQSGQQRNRDQELALEALFGAGQQALNTNNPYLDAAEIAGQFRNADRNFQQQGRLAAQTNPYAPVQFAQQNAIKRALLGGARNVSITPGDPAVAGAMGEISGGMRIPEGGFGPEVLSQFDPAATQAALSFMDKQRLGLDPGAATFNQQGLGLPNDPTVDLYRSKAQDARNAEMSGTDDIYRSLDQGVAYQLQQDEEARKYRQQALQIAQQQGQQGGDDGGGWWKTLAKIGSFAAPFIPGIGPVAGALLGGGLGAVGGGVGGAVSGALGGYLGPMARGGGAANAAAGAGPTSFTSPRVGQNLFAPARRL